MLNSGSAINFPFPVCRRGRTPRAPKLVSQDRMEETDRFQTAPPLPRAKLGAGYRGNPSQAQPGEVACWFRKNDAPAPSKAGREATRKRMKKIAVVGAGHIGSTIAALLSGSGDYEVLVIDRDQAALSGIETGALVSTQAVDAAKSGALRDAIAGAFAVVSAAPYQLTTLIAKAAIEAGVHYLDLTEDVASTHEVERLAEGARKAFIPQCGLAPGFMSIVAFDFVRRFDRVMDMQLRVGALPRYPSNALNYNLTWSTDGVINEYCEPCEAIVDGKLRDVRRWRNARTSPSTASPTRRSTPPAAWARSARRSKARCATSTTAPSAIPATRRS